VLNGARRRDVVEAYLARRGIAVRSPVLRGHAALPYFGDGKPLRRFPAVIAPVLAPKRLIAKRASHL